MGRIVIACYRPKPGRSNELRALTRTHVQRLRAAGLVTDREPIIAESKDGTLIEVFEWKSEAAIEAAHSNPAVLEMWKEYDAVCDYVPVDQVPEAWELFSGFKPVEF